MPPNTAFEYKFIRKETDGSVRPFLFVLYKRDGVLM